MRIPYNKPILLLSLCVLLCTGCLTPGKVVPPKQYLLNPQVSVEVGESTGKTLGMRSLKAARPYAKLNIAYLTHDKMLGYYPDALWAEQPNIVLTRSILDALDETGLFTDTGDAAAMTRPDLILTGDLRKCYEDRSGETPSAVLEIRLELRDPKAATLLWAETLSAATPIQGGNPANTAQAMQQSMEQVLTTICESLSENLR